MARTLRAAANSSLLPNMGAIGYSMQWGDAMTGARMSVNGAVTSHVLTLPNQYKASMILKAYSRAGSTTGELAYVTGGAPTTGQISTTPTGDIICATADAVTSLEVDYMTFDGPLITELVTVASSVATLNASKAAYCLISATVVTGASPGAVTPVARGTASPSSGQAAIQDDPTKVNFNAAQVVAGTATLVYVAQGGVGNGAGQKLKARLEADVDF